MKKNILYATGLGFFLIATQLLFFWLVPTENELFVAAYPFYTVMSVAHAAVAYYIGYKYQYPACFAPIFCGSLIVAIQTVGSIVICLLDVSVRTVLFAEAIAVSLYIIAMTTLIAVTLKESLNSEEPDVPVVPFRDNPTTAPVRVQRRAPKPIESTDYNDNYDM